MTKVARVAPAVVKPSNANRHRKAKRQDHAHSVETTLIEADEQQQIPDSIRFPPEIEAVIYGEVEPGDHLDEATLTWISEAAICGRLPEDVTRQDIINIISNTQPDT